MRKSKSTIPKAFYQTIELFISSVAF